jgi:hypothetical protein
MRTIFAFLLGIAVTIGGAYFRDHFLLDPTMKPMVDWTVVQDSTNNAMSMAMAQINKLMGK